MLANIMLLTLPELAGRDVRLVAGQQTLWLIGPASIRSTGAPGDTISLIPLAGDAHNVRTEDLEYPLRGETLRFGPARGVSNVMQGRSARVSLDAGLLARRAYDGEGVMRDSAARSPGSHGRSMQHSCPDMTRAVLLSLVAGLVLIFFASGTLQLYIEARATEDLSFDDIFPTPREIVRRLGDSSGRCCWKSTSPKRCGKRWPGCRWPWCSAC